MTTQSALPSLPMVTSVPACVSSSRLPSGTGLGAFNDRLRDGALGGGPFAPPQFQVGQGAGTGPCVAAQGRQVG